MSKSYIYIFLYPRWTLSKVVKILELLVLAEDCVVCLSSDSQTSLDGGPPTIRAKKEHPKKWAKKIGKKNQGFVWVGILRRLWMVVGQQSEPAHLDPPHHSRVTLGVIPGKPSSLPRQESAPETSILRPLAKTFDPQITQDTRPSTQNPTFIRTTCTTRVTQGHLSRCLSTVTSVITSVQVRHFGGSKEYNI